MIRKIRIRGFKRFEDIEFDLPGHIVLAGPNNTGKTTILQAIAAWSLALRRWRELNDFNSRRHGYTRVPIARQDFTAVQLRKFDLLWKDRRYEEEHPIEVDLTHSEGWSVTMDFIADSTEQINVRPRTDMPSQKLRELDLGVAFVPPMTGIGVDEPVFQTPKIKQLLGLGRPGEVLRNLLVEAYHNDTAWAALQKSIEKIFGYKLLPPNTEGAHILAEYKTTESTQSLDIASSGTGFQQVLMLLTFLNTRSDSILLLDEPDAHLHIILQDAIYHELRTVAARQRSQLIVATHSEVIINTVSIDELHILLDQPRSIGDKTERKHTVSALRVLSNTDIMQAKSAIGVLYVEGNTDLNILRAWASQLGHRAEALLTTEAMWKAVGNHDRAREHFDALKLMRDDLPGLVLVDGDAHPDIQDSEITGTGLQRSRWRRYEIESYLVHPDALARFVEFIVGIDTAKPHIEDMLAYWQDEFPRAIIRDPLGDHPYLNTTKARKHILPPLLEAAGLSNIHYTRYHEIAQQMLPEEIHPEVVKKLDDICRAFGIEP